MQFAYTTRAKPWSSVPRRAVALALALLRVLEAVHLQFLTRY